jgi:predicted nucleic acid-binding Zn ribbon protein
MKCKNTECNNETSGNRVYCSLTCRNVFVNKYLRDYNKVSDTFNKKKITREVDYLKDAKHCKECNSLIPFDKKNNDFCNKSCSTTYINKNRDITWNDKISESIKRYISINGVFGCLSDKLLIEKVCINCNEKFTNKNKKFCKKSCRVNYNRRIMDDYQRYKLDCSFKFNLNDYSDEFDFSLVKEHGWYSPTNKNNNLKGVSRDHMFSVREGFEMCIYPEIISHPANCKLMIHNENISKNKKSSITIEDLLKRIEYFENKYKNKIISYE